MLNINEYSEKIIKKINIEGAAIEDGSLFFPDISYRMSLEDVYTVYLKYGLIDSILFVRERRKDIIELDSDLKKVVARDIFPLVTGSGLKLCAYRKKGAAERLKEIEGGDLKKATARLVRKFPIIEEKVSKDGDFISLSTGTSYLTASHILAYDFPIGYYVAIPNQSEMLLIRKKQELTDKEQRRLIEGAILSSEVGKFTPGETLNLVIDTKDVLNIRNSLLRKFERK